MSVYIIAEAGVNHNGSVELAYEMIDAAKKAGADCIKFQTFVSKNLVSKYAQKADYQKAATGTADSQLEMLQKLELSFSDFTKLQQYSRAVEIDFISTPFDLESIAFLATLDLPFWKIPSGEITNLPYLLALAKTRKRVIMSTGMCDMADVSAAIRVLKENGTPDIILLHCNTEYPTPYRDVNLRAMQTLKTQFGLNVGYSDHTKGIAVPIAAVAMGAVVVEKHFTLDKNLEGPDHKASLEPAELAEMVTQIRNIEDALGSGEKVPSESERKNMRIARKSIVAKCPIYKGTCFSDENITVKRPGGGISPMEWFNVLGKMASRDFVEDELIEL